MNIFNNPIEHATPAQIAKAEISAIVREGVTDIATITAILHDTIGFINAVFEKPTSPTPAAPTSDLPKNIWLAPMEPATRDWLARCALTAGCIIEHSGSAPSDNALVLCSPLGQDVSSQVLLHGLPATRTVGIDGFMPLLEINHLTLMSNPTTSAATIGSAYALLTSSGKTVSAINDSVGFVVQRVLTLMISAICDEIQQNPTLLNKETYINKGALEFGDVLSATRVAQTLTALQKTTGDTKYRSSMWLQRRAQLNMSLLMMTHKHSI